MNLVRTYLWDSCGLYSNCYIHPCRYICHKRIVIENILIMLQVISSRDLEFRVEEIKFVYKTHSNDKPHNVWGPREPCIYFSLIFINNIINQSTNGTVHERNQTLGKQLECC